MNGANDLHTVNTERDTASASTDRVRLTISDRVAIITLNDPNRRNAITAEMSADLREAVQAVDDDARVHVVVITGAGPSFCAGADRGVLRTANAAQLRQIYDGFLAVADCSLPTIAAVNGPAVGAGLNLALACDIRVAGPRALFDPRFLSLGVHPGGGATWMLQRTIGPSLARAALLFGSSFGAEAAVQAGLALSVTEDPVAAATELASPACSAPRELVVATKATMRSTFHPGAHDGEAHASAVELEIGPQVRSLRSAFG